MDKLRIKTTKINQDSPNEIFNSFKIMGKLLSKVKDAYNLEIKKINKKKEKDAKISNYLPRNDKGGDCTNITKGILRHSVEEGKSAGQFRSTFVKDLLKFLIIKYNRKIETIVDLSAGWGDRLLGCLASVSTFGLKRYVATDPNVDLQEAYKEICEQFPPINHKLSGELTDLEGGGFRYTYTSSYPSSDPLLSQTTYSKTPPVFSAILYPFALEDLSEEQLKPDNTDNDLVFTSIPYFNQELYAVGKQSYETYPTYAEWRDGFLVNFVSQSVKALKNNGFIAVNSAPIKNKTGQHEITNDLENILTNYKKDNVQLKKVANFWYMGKPDSNTLIFEKVVS